MKMFIERPAINLHKQPMGFRKRTNGLSVTAEEHTKLSAFCDALFVFYHRQRDQVKTLYWNQTGFAYLKRTSN